MNFNFRGQRILPGYDFSPSDNKPIKVLVHEFIQSVVFTPFPQDSELQVERLVLAGNIYNGIGFKRKAAFYRRFAALKSVTIRSDWQACYDSLLNSIEGFDLTLDPFQYEKSLSNQCSSVWPGLHVQLIEELITCCKKIKTAQAGTLAIRHMSFMLHAFDTYLSDTKKRETAHDLEELSADFGEDSPVPLRLDTGHVIHPVNLTKFPLCLKVTPQPLPKSMRPVRLVSLSHDHEPVDDPFIFTPLTNYKSTSLLETTSNGDDIVWVQDESCTTTMIVINTLPLKLNVTSIKLLTDGVPLETKPASFTLEPNSDSQVTIEMIGIPRQSKKSNDDSNHVVSSKLEIFGYSTHLLGVKSNCSFDTIPKFRLSRPLTVEICPPLPRLELQINCDGEDISTNRLAGYSVKQDFVVLEAQVNCVIGSDLDLSLTIRNDGNVDLKYLSIRDKIISKSSSSERLIEFDPDILTKASSPFLKPGERLEVPLHIDAQATGAFKDEDSIVCVLDLDHSASLALEHGFIRRSSLKITISFLDSSKVCANESETA